jgi:hypothetical protein
MNASAMSILTFVYKQKRLENICSFGRDAAASLANWFSMF